MFRMIFDALPFSHSLELSPILLPVKTDDKYQGALEHLKIHNINLMIFDISPFGTVIEQTHILFSSTADD